MPISKINEIDISNINSLNKINYSNINKIGNEIFDPVTIPYGEAKYLTPGTYLWTAPENVTEVSAVVIGGGGGSSLSNNGGAGGGGGGLGWKNTGSFKNPDGSQSNIGLYGGIFAWS